MYQLILCLLLSIPSRTAVSAVKISHNTTQEPPSSEASPNFSLSPTVSVYSTAQKFTPGQTFTPGKDSYTDVIAKILVGQKDFLNMFDHISEQTYSVGILSTSSVGEEWVTASSSFGMQALSTGVGLNPVLAGVVSFGIALFSQFFTATPDLSEVLKQLAQDILITCGKMIDEALIRSQLEANKLSLWVTLGHIRDAVDAVSKKTHLRNLFRSLEGFHEQLRGEISSLAKECWQDEKSPECIKWSRSGAWVSLVVSGQTHVQLLTELERLNIELDCTSDFYLHIAKGLAAKYDRVAKGMFGHFRDYRESRGDKGAMQYPEHQEEKIHKYMVHVFTESRDKFTNQQITPRIECKYRKDFYSGYADEPWNKECRRHDDSTLKIMRGNVDRYFQELLQSVRDHVSPLITALDDAKHMTEYFEAWKHMGQGCVLGMVTQAPFATSRHGNIKDCRTFARSKNATRFDVPRGLSWLSKSPCRVFRGEIKPTFGPNTEHRLVCTVGAEDKCPNL